MLKVTDARGSTPCSETLPNTHCIVEATTVLTSKQRIFFVQSVYTTGPRLAYNIKGNPQEGIGWTYVYNLRDIKVLDAEIIIR